jgi:hypothetical protein
VTPIGTSIVAAGIAAWRLSSQLEGRVVSASCTPVRRPARPAAQA